MILNIAKKDYNRVGVYCITNSINNKIYVGSTTINFKHRYQQYKSGFKRNLNGQPILYNAFKKHGFENFTFSILCISNQKDCLKMEQFYIDRGTDYNSCLIAGSLLGLKHKKDSKTRTIIGGLHHCAKPIYQFTLDGSLMQKHLSIIEALKSIGKSKNGSSHLTQCCLGNTYSAFRYRWSFTNSVFERPNRLGKCKVNISNDVISIDCASQKETSLFISSLGHKCNQGRINRSITKTKEKVYGFVITKIN